MAVGTRPAACASPRISVILNLDDLPKKQPVLHDQEYGDMSLGKSNTIFIGGIAHGVSHAFALPHCGERADEQALGTSIMGWGNHTYREERRGEGKGSFLTLASAMRLAGNPLFNGSDKGSGKKTELQSCDLILSTNLTRADLAGKRGALRLAGTVAGSPQIYGVVAYFDSALVGGYRAPTACSVPDAQGKFRHRDQRFEALRRRRIARRVLSCERRGVRKRRLGFSVTPEGSVDISQWEMRQALQPVADAVGNDDPTAARAALAGLEKSQAPEPAKIIARKLLATLEDKAKPSPASVPPEVTELPLGDCQPEIAKVGWLTPAANRIPANDEIKSPLLDSGKIHATGLFAHAPSCYVFDLGGNWKTLARRGRIACRFLNPARLRNSFS